MNILAFTDYLLHLERIIFFSKTQGKFLNWRLIKRNNNLILKLSKQCILLEIIMSYNNMSYITQRWTRPMNTLYSLNKN